MNQPVLAERYRAFLSYSHCDERACSRFHEALEEYRLPRSLVGRITAHGAVPAKLFPVFRDRDELPTASDLSAVVQRALERSDFLIVLCSPAAAQSRWVNEEVARYVAMGRGDRVLPVLVAGSADADAQPSSFPPAMRAAAGGGQRAVRLEAAQIVDLRGGRAARRRGLLQVVATIIGVRSSILLRRDRRRRRRDRAIASVVASGIAIALGVLAWRAVDAQREAEFRRRKAEELVEFLIGDMRAGLQSAGRLDIMESVGERALHYYLRHPPSADNVVGTGQLTRALHILGEVALRRDDVAAARRALTRAEAASAALLQRRPQDPLAIRLHAQSRLLSARLAWRESDLASAQRGLDDHLHLLRSLVRIAPAEQASCAELMQAHLALGRLARAKARPDVAETHLLQALELAQRNAPAAAADLARIHAERAELSAERGDLQQALRHTHRQLRAWDEALREEPANRDFETGRAAAQISHARLLHWLGQRDAAEARLVQAGAVVERLVALDPYNLTWRQDRLRVLQAQASIALDRGDLQRARDLLASAERQLTPETGDLAGDRLRVRQRLLRAELDLLTGREARALGELAELMADTATDRLNASPEARAQTALLAARVLLVQGEPAGVTFCASALNELAGEPPGAQRIELQALAQHCIDAGEQRDASLRALALQGYVPAFYQRHVVAIAPPPPAGVP